MVEQRHRGAKSSLAHFGLRPWPMLRTVNVEASSAPFISLCFRYFFATWNRKMLPFFCVCVLNSGFQPDCLCQPWLGETFRDMLQRCHGWLPSVSVQRGKRFFCGLVAICLLPVQRRVQPVSVRSRLRYM